MIRTLGLAGILALGAWWLLAHAAAPVTWAPGPVLNQLGPTCVAFALSTFEQTAPAATRGPSPLALYAAAQATDGIPGAHDGTYVGAALGVLVREGWVSTYDRTPPGTTAIGWPVLWLQTRGPVVVQGPCRDMLAGGGGTRTAACSTPDRDHVWICYGVGPGDALACQTSWGTILGRFGWTGAALARTLGDGGIVWFITKRGPRLRIWPI